MIRWHWRCWRSERLRFFLGKYNQYHVSITSGAQLTESRTPIRRVLCEVPLARFILLIASNDGVVGVDRRPVWSVDVTECRGTEVGTGRTAAQYGVREFDVGAAD